MKTLRRSFAWISERVREHSTLRKLAEAGVWDLGDPGLGTEVTRSNSSWVRRLIEDSIDCYIKTYDYPTCRSRARGWLRNTACAPSRADREKAAAEWLRAHGLEAPEPLILVELRSLSGLHRAVFVTKTWPGTALDRLLPRLEVTQQQQVLHQVIHYVDRMHALGFRDRNLDLRNFLARQSESNPSTWIIAKLDSPRWRLMNPQEIKYRQADWRRLRTSIEASGIATPNLLRSRQDLA